ncbi:hypothetical protein PRK78_007522 [Emydomyces testavorans]|uniref:Uncharacterized protein n=1 Tax=Emydomyces testavorans TaxID=2070801 RepID=A0AAF0IMT2_9EURO|nr:hypothetical protein PRK78_007522 [Emydomyces testavorans]
MPTALVSAAAQHLARRGVSGMQQNGPGDERPNVPIVAGATLIIFAIVVAIVQYTFGMVVPTLAMVEDPHPTVYASIPSDDNGQPKNVAETTECAGRQGVITAKIRTTLRHLRARGGFWAPFRGIGVCAVYIFCRSILISIFSFGASHSRIFTHSLAAIAAEVALTGLALTWIHTVISEPSANTRPLLRRIPAYRTWKKAVLAVALRSTASQICFLLPLYLGIAIYGIRLDNDSLVTMPQLDKPTTATVIGSVAILLLSLALFALVEIPAIVTMVRVCASTLPLDVDTIVPFDRTFGGKIEPAVLGGGTLGLLDAWKSFTWPARIRLLKLLVKCFAIMVTVCVVFGVTFAVEMLTLGRGNLDKL